jgi:hypothetical protein
MNWPSGVEWEWAIGDFALLAFLFWELRKLKRAKQETRARLEREKQEKSGRDAS